MNFLLIHLAVVLLGGCVMVSHSASAQKAEFHLGAEENYNANDGDVNALVHVVEKRRTDLQPASLSVSKEKRGIQDHAQLRKNRRTKKSTSSALADADADAAECNAKPPPLSDIDKQRLLIEVLNTGPATLGDFHDNELFAFENHHGCVASRQASSAMCDGGDGVRVVHVDAGGKELVNESIHFENNIPKSVEVETADRIVVHDLGSPSNSTSEGKGAKSKLRPCIVSQVKIPEKNASCASAPGSQSEQGVHLLKVGGVGQQQQRKNEISPESVAPNPGNTRPLKLDDWKNQPSSLRQAMRTSCVSTAGPGHPPPRSVGGYVRLQPRQEAQPQEGVGTVDRNPLSGAERTPPRSTLIDSTSNLMQYRLAPWGIVEPLRFSASNAPGPKNNLLPSFLAQNLVLFPDVALPKAPVADDPAKRANNGDAMTLIVVQPEATPVGLSGPGSLLLVPENIAADRHYVLVPAEDLLVAAPESALAQTSVESAAHPDKEAATGDNKYAYAKANRRPEHSDLLNHQDAEAESSKKAVHDKQSALESKFHDVDADRDVFNVGAEGSAGTCCGPNCHCTCNLVPERHPAVPSLVPSSASRRHFVPDSNVGRVELGHRWPARKLARVKSSAGQDAQQVEHVQRKSVEDHAYPKVTQMKAGEFALPQHLMEPTGRFGGDPRRAATARQFDGNLRRVVPLGGIPAGVQESRGGELAVYQQLFRPRYKREGGGGRKKKRKTRKSGVSKGG